MRQEGLGRMLQGLRQERGWTAAETAGRAGVPPRSVELLEADRDVPDGDYERVLALFGLDRLSAAFVARGGPGKAG